MRLIGSLVVAAVTVATPLAGARAESSPAAAVRGFFSALARQDFSGALALTDGSAQTCTSHMVNRLKSEAAAHNARVEVKVTNLDVRSPGVPEARGVPVAVAFHIDVVGKKWCFSKVARKLDGEARFWVDPSHPDRIVAIDGNLE
ncbi:MAG TPA: hypothetical protein VGL86_03600 [Polyangia bacterium]|jgi:hypothetical protein